MEQAAPFVVRISPRAQTLTFKHPLVSRVIRRPTDSNDPTKGWVGVTSEEAAILRPIRVGGASDRHAPPLFDVMTQEDAIAFQQAEMERLGLGTPENPVGGSPIQAAKIARLEAEMASMRAESSTQNARILQLLTVIAAKNDPALAEALKSASPDSLNLELAPGTAMPDSAIDPPPPDEARPAATRPPQGGGAQGGPARAAAPAAPQGAAAGQGAPKQRPGAAPPAAAAGQGAPKGAAAKKAAGEGGGPPESLTAKMRAEGTISGKAPEGGDLPEDKPGTAGADSA